MFLAVEVRDKNGTSHRHPLIIPLEAADSLSPRRMRQSSYVSDDEFSDQYREELQRLFEDFDGKLISPGGAAGLLGVSRKTIHELGRRGRLRMYRGPDEKVLKGLVDAGPRWVYIPLEDVAA